MTTTLTRSKQSIYNTRDQRMRASTDFYKYWHVASGHRKTLSPCMTRAVWPPLINTSTMPVSRSSRSITMSKASLGRFSALIDYYKERANFTIWYFFDIAGMRRVICHAMLRRCELVCNLLSKCGVKFRLHSPLWVITCYRPWNHWGMML